MFQNAYTYMKIVISGKLCGTKHNSSNSQAMWLELWTNFSIGEELGNPELLQNSMLWEIENTRVLQKVHGKYSLGRKILYGFPIYI